MNYLLTLLWIISMVILVLFPYSIALFYQRSFKRNTYPYLFLISIVLFFLSSLGYVYSSIPWGNVFFALGGLLLGAASLRLHHVMTKRWT